MRSSNLSKVAGRAYCRGIGLAWGFVLKITYLAVACVTVASILLGGCISPGQITPLDNGIYMITTKAYFLGVSATADGVEQAQAFCQQRGKRMELTNSQSADAVLGIVPARSAVMFRCID